MESDARPPQQLTDKGPMARNWKRWKQDFLIYMKLTGGMNKPEDEKVAWLKNLIGQVGLVTLETISFENPDDKDNMTIIMQKLEEFFDPPRNEVQERNKFFQRWKKLNESIDAYIDNLKVMAKFCNFGDQMESLVRDVVILNIKDKHLRTILLEEKDLDLEKIKIIYKTYELNNSKMKEVSKESIPEEAKFQQKTFAQKKPDPKEPKNPCWRCGEKHPLRACPAFRNICCYCKNINHFSHRCPVAKLDFVKITAPGSNTADTNPNNSASPFGIEKNRKLDKGHMNNLNSLANNDKDKINPKHEILKSDPLVKNFEIVDSGNPKKIQNQFTTRSNSGKVTSQHSPQITTGMQPSALPESLMDLKIQKPPLVSRLSTRKPEFLSNRRNILESSEKGQSVSQSNFQVPSAQNSHPPREYASLYPKLPSNSATVPQYSQNNLQSNVRSHTRQNLGSVYSSDYLTKEPVKSKQKSQPDCVIL